MSIGLPLPPLNGVWLATWNIHSLGKKYLAVADTILAHNMDLLVVTESWHRSPTDVAHQCFSFIASPSLLDYFSFWPWGSQERLWVEGDLKRHRNFWMNEWKQEKNKLHWKLHLTIPACLIKSNCPIKAASRKIKAVEHMEWRKKN